MTGFGSSTLQPFRKVVDGAMKWARETPHPHSLSMATSACQEAAPSALKDLFFDENEVPNEGRVRARKSALQACLLEESSSPRCEEESVGNLGYKLGLTKTYAWGQELGRGANGIVRVVQHIPTGKEYACKTIPKVLGDDASETKKAGHVAAIAKEINVMRKLSSCLNVAKLIDVYEDSTHVHIISEWCKGGTLDEVVGKKHYSERTVASYMRGVLKTIAQCHANNIIHRDVKPGNFLLLSDEPDAPIKAIDFGLAETYNRDDELPLTHLGMEGTPWFLAPETISSKWSPAADVWAAGVMAHQLLTGRMPFDDRRNPHNPVLTTVLRSILSDKLDFNKAYWADISDEAKDFIKKMLDRDVKKRPTAREALQHPWLTGDVSDRQKGKQLNLNVVQRIQRYGRSSSLKRTVFEMIVSEVMDDASPSGLYECTLDSKARALIDSPSSGALNTVLRYLQLHNKSIVDRDTVAKGLRDMGYRIADEELERLMEIIGDNPQLLTKDSVISSQMDWRHLQRNHTDHWIELAKKAFSNIDLDGDGVINVDEMISSLQNRLPAHEIEKAYADAVNDGLIEASKARRMDFATFMRLMRMPSQESLDLYDDRLEGTVRSLGETSGHSSSPNRSLHSSHAGIPIGCGAQARSMFSHTVKRSSLDNLRHCTLSASMDPSTRHGTLHGSLATVFESNQN